MDLCPNSFPSPAFFASSAGELKNLRSLTLAALMASIYAVSYSPLAGNIVIVPGLMEFRFGFLALAVAAMLCGPFSAMMVAFIGDLFGTIIFYGGGFFFGYTFSWMLTGFVFGLFFYREKISLPRILGAMLFNSAIINMLLTTLWQSMLGFGDFQALFSARLVRNLLIFPVNTILLFLVLRGVLPVYRRIARSAT